ncbi:MAG: hypothetical protein E7027_05635 [Elusimicrobium sp.]|uniref:Uncharacterized protein n=1 Tax=Candidatus Avelusimicrobium gallicola TaxID=2562704 RepID=A0A928DQI2_9BACT|nr:hypothetical protein [Elusimicrobium sp.]
MKKLLTVFGVLLGCSSVFCHAAEDNKMKMITYFPVPYVAYSQVQVSEQMDVGLNATSAQMTLGDSDASYSLSATNVNLNKGKLELAASYPSSSYLLNKKTVIGSDTKGAAEVNFSNLSVGSVTNAKSIEAEVFNPSSLKIFGYPFPDCNADISWQRVKLNEKDEVYLVCGAAEEEEAPCAPTYNGLETYTESCPVGSTGQITYTWDYTNCKYKQVSFCKMKEIDLVKTYGYILTNQQKSVGGNLCTVACMMSAYNAPVGGLTSIPSSYGADYFTPNCTASNLGHTCNMNLTVSGTQYCATYTCKEL